jgi:hypothetical protein
MRRSVSSSRVHLKRQNRHRDPRQSIVHCDVEGQRALSAFGGRGNRYHLTGLQTACCLVKRSNACRKTRQPAAVLVVRFVAIQGPHDQLAHVLSFSFALEHAGDLDQTFLNTAFKVWLHGGSYAASWMLHVTAIARDPAGQSCSIRVAILGTTHRPVSPGAITAAARLSWLSRF